MKQLSVTLFLPLLFSACIQFRINKDGSQGITKSDTSNLSEFRLSDTGKDKIVSTPEKINFQEIDAEQIKQIIQLHKKTWVYVWGSWCTPCRKKIPLIAQIHRDNPEWNIILVADDYNIVPLQKLLFEQSLFVQAYILDSRKYGDKIHEKEKKLWEDLNLGGSHDEGFPQNYLFDNNGELLFYGSGSIPPDLMNSYFSIR